MTPTDTLRVMPREMRLMSERILSLTALPKGFALMIGDVVMLSQALGLGGFALLEQRLPLLRQADPRALTLEGDSLDAGGQQAWIVLASLIDHLGLQLAQGQPARITLRNLSDPAELAVAVPLGARVGLAVTLDGLLARATPRATREDPVLHRLLHEGCQIEPALWWRIYDCAQTALTPDSVVSRRHAGPVIVTEDGRVIGRSDNDDDTDVGFLARVDVAQTRGTTA